MLFRSRVPNRQSKALCIVLPPIRFADWGRDARFQFYGEQAVYLSDTWVDLIWLESLKKEGIKRVLIVTGFQESKYIEYLQPNNKLPKIEFIHSPRFAETGSMHSLFVAKNYLNENFLLLEFWKPLLGTLLP